MATQHAHEIRNDLYRHIEALLRTFDERIVYMHFLPHPSQYHHDEEEHDQSIADDLGKCSGGFIAEIITKIETQSAQDHRADQRPR